MPTRQFPMLIADFDRRLGGKARPRLIAKLVGGANMFQMDPGVRENSGLNIGRRNQEAIEQILNTLTIPIIARDVGGTHRPTVDPGYDVGHGDDQGSRRY